MTIQEDPGTQQNLQAATARGSCQRIPRTDISALLRQHSALGNQFAR